MPLRDTTGGGAVESLGQSARTPFTAAENGISQVKEGSQSSWRQLFLLCVIAVLSVLAASLGLGLFWSSDFVQGRRPGGPVRGYTVGEFLAMCLWMLAGPLAIGCTMKSTLIAYKTPQATRPMRSFVAALLCIFGLATVFVGAFWLQASELLECGYLWCYDAEPSTADASGFKAIAGSEVFALGVLISGLAAILLVRAQVTKATLPSAPDRMNKIMKRATRAHIIKQHVSIAVLLVAVPLMLLLTGLLPNTFERFSRNVGPPQQVHSLKYFVGATGGINGTMPSEKPDAWMVTLNWRLSDDVVVKFFPDTLLFYGFLEGVVLVFALQSRSQFVRRMLAQKLRGFFVGRMLLAMWFALFLGLFIYYWAHDHLFHGDGKFDKYGLEKPARIAGLVGLMALALLLLPASKSSPLLAAAGVSWESALWVHIILAVLFLAASVLHVLLYFIRFVQLGHGLDVLPLNAKFWYPQNPIGGDTPSDNWTVPMMSTAFWPSLIIFGVFPWMRRKYYELFRYSHNFFMILVPAAFWHATNSWYFLLPGVSLWLLDRFLRFLSATEAVTVQDCTPYSVDCWTDPMPGRPSRNLAEKITRIGFSWPGQTRTHSPGMYVLVNFPQISLGEWHPFSLSSSPLDHTATLHVKNMGDNTFSGKLHALATNEPSCSDVVMNIQGPYGPRIDMQALPRALLVAGGIGVTPMVNTVRWAAQRALCSPNGGNLKRLHLVWSARSPDVFSIFQDELAMKVNGPASELPFELIFSLYCSTIQEARSCPLGTVNAGMPNFREILASEAALGPGLVRVCGPPPMVNACAEAVKIYEDTLDFEPWSFVL